VVEYDVVVIGGGPGGYVAAIRCAQLGMKTVCVDAGLDSNGEPSLGGVCLNVGCIPSKALLDSSHHYYALNNEFKHHGITCDNINIDLSTMMARKDAIVKSLTGGVAMLFLKNKVTWIKGYARLIAHNHVEIHAHKNTKETQELKAKHVIIATGSLPAQLESIAFDGDSIVDSTAALSFEDVPKRLAVIGAGVVGLELGSVWSRLGAKTLVFNRGASFLRAVDQQLAAVVKEELKNQGLEFKLDLKINSVKKLAKHVMIKYSDNDGEHSVNVDKVLIAVGRKPNSDHINAEGVGLHVNQRGFIEVDEYCRTNLPGVYAIGDVVRGPMLAHKASEEGIAVAERISGQTAMIDFHRIPWVVYIWPELAWVGRTSEQLDAMNTQYNTGVFPLRGNGRSLAMGVNTGLIKILSDAKTDEILGVHMFCPNASELIGEAVVAMEFHASAEDLARTIHAHPTVSEAIHEAALDVDNRSIHQ